MATIIIISSITDIPAPTRGTVVNLTMKDGSPSGPFMVEDVGGGMEEGDWTAVLRSQDGSSKVVNSKDVTSVATGGEWRETQERAYRPTEPAAPAPVVPSEGVIQEPIEDVRGSINAMVDRYIDLRNSTDQEDLNEKFIIFERIWNHPYGKSTVGRTLMKASKANSEKAQLSTEGREADCRDFLENVLKRAEKGKPFFGFLSSNMRHLRRAGGSWDDRIYPKFLPYMEEFYGRGDAGLIDDDIREMGAPNMVVWEAYRRNEWNNYKTEDGKDRIGKAIEKMESTINEQINNEVSSIQDQAQKQARSEELRSSMLPLVSRGHFQTATAFLEERGVDQTWKNQASADWLNHNMVEPARHALGPRQVAKYLNLFDKSRSPDSPEAFEKKAPPLFLNEKPKNPFKELVNEIKDTARSADEVIGDKSEDPYVQEQAKTLKDRIRNIDPSNPDRMRRIMEFIRDEYEDSDPKHAIAGAFVDLPMPTGKGDQLEQMRKHLSDNLLALVKTPSFTKPRRDETFGLSPAQRFNIYLVEFIQDVKRVLMDEDLWRDMAQQVGITAQLIRAMIRTAILFARNIKRS